MTDQLEDYIAKEQARGIGNEKIRSELVAKGWDPIRVHRLLNSDTPEEKPVGKSHFDGSNILLLAGLGLIFIAAATFIGYSWPELAPLTRFLLVAVPNILLFAIGSFLAKGEQLENARESTHMAGYLLLPITVGVFLYQFGYYSKSDPLLMAYSVMIAWPLAFYGALFRKNSYGGALITVYLIALAVFLYADRLLDGWISASALTAASLLGLFTAWRIKKQIGERSVPALVSVGTVVLAVSSVTLIDDLVRLVIADKTASVALSSFLSGLGLLTAAALFGRFFKPWSRLELTHQRLLIAAAVLVGVAGFIQADSDAALLSLISAAFSALVVVVGIQSRVRIMTILGMIGGAASLFNLLFSSVDKVIIVILMFLMGFAAVIVSILLAKRGANVRDDSSPEWSIGFIDDQTAATLSVNGGGAPTFFTVLVRILLVIIAYLLLQYWLIGEAIIMY